MPFEFDTLLLITAISFVAYVLFALSGFGSNLVTVPLLGQDVKGHGKVCTKQPGLFSMRFVEPKGDVLLADGSFLWRYTPSTDPNTPGIEVGGTDVSGPIREELCGWW